VETGREAIEEFPRFKPDVIVLDVLLADMSGVDVCREIREEHHEPIIVLSAVGDEATKIAALDAGADDYVTKPFGAGELLARIRVALRRGATDRMQVPIISAEGLRIDLEHHRVDVDNREVHLTPTEFSLLRYLATNHGRLATQSMILKAVWGDAHAGDSHILRTYINQLRSKLGDDGRARRLILTEPGIGYRFVDTETS
jgi:two-component system KDP operon response regulator KdpE